MFLTCLLLCKGDIGVHQAPRDAVGNKDDKICFQAENQLHCITTITTDVWVYLIFRPKKLVQVNT